MPASPLVRIIAAPSATLLTASPRLVHPHTNGTVKLFFAMWKKGSAGVNTSDSSIISAPSSSSTLASSSCPILALAITGIEVVSIISLIISGWLIRATPPLDLISAGTLSKAMTETAPASSAICASSALTTSMMTPPSCILAKPRFSNSVPCRMFSSLTR